jgi:hypothetical protein
LILMFEFGACAPHTALQILVTALAITAVRALSGWRMHPNSRTQTNRAGH